MAEKLTVFLLFGMDWQIAFADYPQLYWKAGLPGLLQAWSLAAELTFYLLARFLLRSRKMVMLVFLASAVIRIIVVCAFGFSTTWTYLFLPATFLFFLLGDIARWWQSGCR